MERAGYLLATENEPRVRRARDAAKVVLGVVLILATMSSVVRSGLLQQSIVAVTADLPGWTEVTFWFGYAAGAVYAAAVVVALVLRAGRNPGAARDVVLAVVGAAVIAALLMQWRSGAWPVFLAELAAEKPEPQYPILRVAVVTATVLASAPHVARAVRRLGKLLILVVAFSGFGLGFGFPSDAIAALGIGLLVAGGVLLLWGSPSGYPPVAVVSSALAQLGIEVSDLKLAQDQSWGTRRFAGTVADGSTVEVKAYGRDASDSELAAKLWRALWYRGTTATEIYTRMQAIEHEALVTVFAQRAGVSTVEPLAAAVAGDDVAILAVRRYGRPLSEVPPDEVTDELLVGVWQDMGAMHSADIAHGSLGLGEVLVVGSGHYFADFGSGALSAGDRRHLDVVEFLFATSAHVGTERAVAMARRGLGDERLTAALPFFQLHAVSTGSRRTVTKPKAFMQEVREALANSVDVELPEPVKLRRVSLGQLLMLALILFAANALISQLAGIDYEAVWGVLRDANWLTLLIALPVAQSMFIPEAAGMMAAVGQPLPMRPLVVLQLAARFIGLAVPSAAGRVAMNSAFLVKFGLSPAVAVVQGAIDGLSGFVVEAGILLVALALSERSFDLGGSTNVDFQRILLIMVAIVVIGLILSFAVRRLRELVLPVVKEALGSVLDVIKDPQRGLRLLANNFVARVILGVALWLILRAIGVDDISIAVALSVTVATNLLAGLVPVPGGIGVAEAVMTSWLVLVGVPEAEAFAATVIYRMWTFYLPAVEGAFALRWLERRDYI